MMMNELFLITYNDMTVFADGGNESLPHLFKSHFLYDALYCDILESIIWQVWEVRQ